MTQCEEEESRENVLRPREAERRNGGREVPS